jgi:hypothetical protein
MQRFIQTKYNYHQLPSWCKFTFSLELPKMPLMVHEKTGSCSWRRGARTENETKKIACNYYHLRTWISSLWLNNLEPYCTVLPALQTDSRYFYCASVFLPMFSVFHVACASVFISVGLIPLLPSQLYGISWRTPVVAACIRYMERLALEFSDQENIFVNFFSLYESVNDFVSCF